jgi:hypothetical protein
MNPKDEQALRSALTRARGRLDALARDLRVVDDELDALSGERARYSLLQAACAALEELSSLGAAGLFWGERGSDREGDDHVRRVRGRVDVFQKRLGEIEDRRQAVIEEIERQHESAGFLEDDILELERQEEERKLEWVVERDVATFPEHALVMPWTRGGEDDERFRRTLRTSLLLGLLLGLLFPQIPLPLPELREPIDVPERLTRLIQERPRTPPPPPQETRPEEKKPEPLEKLAAEAAKPRPGPQQAPKEAPGSKGILAFREQFSGLAANKPAAALGLQARIDRAGEVASGAPTRSMVTTQAPGSSGGINLAALSRGVGGSGGGQQLDGVQVARATSTIAAIGGGGGAGGDRGVGGDGPPLGRTDEEIQIVFDRHKAALYRLYNRELRSDPTLKGQMVLRLRIEPDGSVSLCELHGTDMNAPQLSAQVVERVRTFDFGAKEGISAITILYPIDFLPAT